MDNTRATPVCAAEAVNSQIKCITCLSFNHLILTAQKHLQNGSEVLVNNPLTARLNPSRLKETAQNHCSGWSRQFPLSSSWCCYPRPANRVSVPGNPQQQHCPLSGPCSACLAASSHQLWHSRALKGAFNGTFQNLPYCASPFSYLGYARTRWG